MSVSLNVLQRQLADTRCRDRRKFIGQFKRIRRADEGQRQPLLDTLSEQMALSALAVEQRAEQRPTISYPPLPVSEHKDELIAAIREHQVVIIAGETGSGKTTQLPKICLEAGRGLTGLIGHTQPRRLAARSVANRIAEELNSPLGERVGFKIRFSDNVSDDSYIKLMTDGILLAEIQQDRFLNQYDTLIIDEAHERSLNIDFILGYLKQLLPKRPDLKLIITSATIDPERFSRHFNDAPMFQVSGRTYPVDVRYRPLVDMRGEDDEPVDQTQGIIQAVDELSAEGRGDILVFLSGEREIRDTADALQRRQLPHTEVIPLYARLSASEQNRIFAAHSGRRIVLATNVAETSLTVPGIKYVIDPGMARISRYSYRSKVQRLPIEAISQASANQRAGRCGRVSAGVCIRLYDEQDFVSRDEFTTPEILRTNLASVILQMLALGLGDIAEFPFVEMPDNRQINDGFRLLEEIQAITVNQGQRRLTALGRQIARLPVDPRYGRMLVEASNNNCLKEVMVIVAGLSIQDPRERPQDKRQAADQQHQQWQDNASDFVALLNLWLAFRESQQQLTNNQLRKWCTQHFVNYLRMREWQDIVSQLKKSIAELGWGMNSTDANYDSIHTALLSGLLSHIGQRDQDRQYLGARNSHFMVFPGSPLSKGKSKWVMAAELVETSRLFARVVAKIEPQWLEPLAKHLSKTSYVEPHWSKKRGAVMAFENVTLFGLPIVTRRAVNYSVIDPTLCRELFIRHGLLEGDSRLDYPFLSHNREMVEQVQALEDKSRRRDVLVDEQLMYDFYAERLPDSVVSEVSFKKWWKKQGNKLDLNFDLERLKQHDAEQVNALNYPDSWQQGNIHLPLLYHFSPGAEDDGVSVQIPIGLLNQIKPAGFDWLVPGLRHELVVALIKSLPKQLRRNFVPAPDYAQACLADMPVMEQPLLEALSTKLKRMSGVTVEQEQWDMASIPEHLKFNFQVTDEKQQVLAQGRDLTALQHKLSDKVKTSLRKVASPDVEQIGLTEWNFGPVATEYSQDKGGYQVKAFPALVDNGQSVAIKLFDQPLQAKHQHQLGLRKLLRLNIPSPVKYLQEKLPNKAKLGLYFNPFGQIKGLIDDCIDAAIDSLLAEKFSDVRDPQVFQQACDWVRAELNDRVLAIATAIEPGLTLAHQIKKKMKGNVPLNMINAHSDIQQQLSSLVFPGFVTATGEARLGDWWRYIQAIMRRLEKLPIDVNRDRLQQLSIERVQRSIDEVAKRDKHNEALAEAVEQAGWMLQELRVSLFAQQLGTAYPISEKRILNYLQDVCR